MWISWHTQRLWQMRRYRQRFRVVGRMCRGSRLAPARLLRFSVKTISLYWSLLRCYTILGMHRISQLQGFTPWMGRDTSVGAVSRNELWHWWLITRVLTWRLSFVACRPN